MAAAAKLRKTQEIAAASRPYARKLKEVLDRTVATAQDISNPLMVKRDVKTVGIVVITSDSGLAGGYNSNLLRKALAEAARFGAGKGFVVIGRKGRDFLRRRDKRIDLEYTQIKDTPAFSEAVRIARAVTEAYIKGIYDEVHLIYQEFVSPAQQRPVCKQLLPIACELGEEKDRRLYLYEPGPDQVLDILLPKYLNTVIYQALMEAKAGEHGARMTAMSSATDNAGELIDELTLTYNRARQAAITREIAEIVGGVNALQA